MLSVITGFIDELRASGVPVSMVEAIDAMKAVESIDISERVALRETLRATLVKNLRHERAFDTAFDPGTTGKRKVRFAASAGGSPPVTAGARTIASASRRRQTLPNSVAMPPIMGG